MKVEVAILDSPSLIDHTTYGLCGRKATFIDVLRAQELRESRGGHPGLPVPNSPYGLCGRKATLNLNIILKGLRLKSGAAHSKIAQSKQLNNLW